MRSRLRRRGHETPDLEVTSFINLMVVLVTFFLGSATYFQNAVLELNIPPAVTGAANPSEALQLEVTIRPDSLDVGDHKGGLIQRIKNKNGTYDFKGLNETLKQVKVRFPDKKDAVILSEPNTPYQVLVKTMDATRTFAVVSAGSVRFGELFPDISLGDAPGTQP
ncbi:MAG: biopolymer transporter ExbD [Gammaproteobacteria bacterium]|nr:biopolymer transporter ExbD [Gammaproteobacteria bacterium]